MFSECVDDEQASDERSRTCVRTSTVVFNRTHYETRQTQNGALLCIYYANYADYNTYKAPELVTDATNFSDYKNLYAPETGVGGDGPSYAPEARASTTYASTNYRVGDPLLAVHEQSGAIVQLSLPQAVLVGNACSEHAPMLFFVTTTSRCPQSTAAVTRRQQSCTRDPTLAASFYFDSLSLLRSSANLWRLPNESRAQWPTTPINVTTTLANGSTTLSPPPSPELTPERQNTSTASSSSATAYVCRNVVEKAHYTFTVNASYGIVACTLELKLADVSERLTGAVFTQTLSTSFRWASAGDTMHQRRRRSGNPGYVRGKPILAGTYTTDNNSVGAIRMPTDSEQWLTVLQSDAEGMCDWDGDERERRRRRVPVRFGENMHTGCLIEMHANATLEYCQTLQRMVLELLAQPASAAANDSEWGHVDDAGADGGTRSRRLNRVGVFGNASVENTLTDWTPIIVVDEPSAEHVATLVGTGACGNMVSSR